jgi:hypothetical protein
VGGNQSAVPHPCMGDEGVVMWVATSSSASPMDEATTTSAPLHSTGVVNVAGFADGRDSKMSRQGCGSVYSRRNSLYSRHKSLYSRESL